MKRFFVLLVAALLVAGAATAQDNKKKEPKDWAKFGYYEKANAELLASGINRLVKIKR